VIRVHPGTGFHLADAGDLIRTCVIEAVLAAVVITVSAVRRRHRGAAYRRRQGVKRHAGAATDGSAEPI
jgi:hypothetical protein